MEHLLAALPTLDRMGAMSTIILVAALIITNRLIWHTRFDKMEKDRDKWQQIAIDALTGPAQAGVRAAEVAVGVVSALPDPAQQQQQQQSTTAGGG